MSGLGVVGLVAFVALVAVLVLAVRHFRPAGRHSMASNRVKVIDLAAMNDSKKTVIRGDLFGTDVIGGYQVDDENNDSTIDRDGMFAARPRPYVEHWWRQQVEDTVQLPEFVWFDGIQNEGNSSALAMIG